MLGGKYNLRSELKPKHCKCKARGHECPRDESCQCRRYCKANEQLYAFISERLTKRCFLTFSPKPITDSYREFTNTSDYDRLLEFANMITSDKNIVAAIIVPELTLKGQLHFHAYLRFKDKVKFIKKVVQPLFNAGNVLPIYGAPKEGIHYLFKESKTMKKYMGAKAVVTKISNKKDSIASIS